MNEGMIGAIVGSVLGLAGGVLGTWISIRNTAGRERACAIRLSALCWLMVGTMLGLMWWMPHPERHWMWVPYGLGLPAFIYYSNRSMARARREEAA